MNSHETNDREGFSPRGKRAASLSLIDRLLLKSPAMYLLFFLCKKPFVEVLVTSHQEKRKM